MKHLCTALTSLFAGVLLTAAPLLPKAPARSKLIDLSWSVPDVNYYVKNLKILEQYAPVDGLVISVAGKARKVNGRMFRPGSHNPMGKIAWQYEDFKDAVAKLKQTKSQKFTDNFFYTVVSPGDIDWFSDADWKSVVSNYGIAARIAKETGMKGLLVDIEEYGKHFWKFKAGSGTHSLAEARAIARKRGQAWGKAVFGAYPEIRCFFLHFLNMAASSFSLVGPFLDGVFDVMPPEVLVFDGQESSTYTARKGQDYDTSYRLMARSEVLFLSPENRLKHRNQVRLAPAFYMDAMFPVSKNERYYQKLRPEIDSDALNFFQRNLLCAMERAEGYIWLYGERGCWWPNSRHRRAQTRWEERAPGISRFVELVRAPEKFASDSSRNLLKKGKWNFWQAEDDIKNAVKPGKGTQENGMCKASGVNNGCFTQNLPVKPGEIYLFRASFRLDNKDAGCGSIQVCYQTAAKKWMKARQNACFYPEKSGEWVTAVVLATVPPEGAFASIQLGVCGQRKTDSASFKDAVFIQIDK